MLPFTSTFMPSGRPAFLPTHAVASKKTRPLPSVPSALTSKAIQTAFFGIGVGDVKRLFVGRKGDAVGPGHVLGQQRQLAVLGDAVDAAEIEFAGGVVPVLFQAVGRIGEIKIAVGFEDEIVGAVEAFALVFVGENGLFAVLFNTGDAAVAMLAEQSRPSESRHQAVAARFAAARRRAGIAAGLEVRLDALCRACTC